MSGVANVTIQPSVPKVVNFKAGENEVNPYRPQRQAPVITRPPMNDQVMLQRMIQEQQKKEQKQKLKQNLSWSIGIASGVAIIAMVLAQLKMMKSGGKQEMKNLTDTVIKWTDFKGTKRRTAKLTDGTTHKNIKAQFDKAKNAKVLSEEAKTWAGVTEQADIYYIYGYGGTGKTYSTEQYAEDLQAIYTCVKYPDLGSPFKDAASMKINNFFNGIIKMGNEHPDRPIVVCIDESDALIQKVSEQSLSEEAKKVRSAVITGIDNIAKNAKNVKLFLTSNYHPDSGIVDDVVLRRINKKIRVDLPDTDQAKALFKMYLSKVKAIQPEFYESDAFKKFVDKVTTKGDELGYSNGEINNIVREAISEFASTLKDVPADKLKEHPFDIKFLEDALKTVGTPAARTNTTMLTAEQRGYLKT